MNRSDRCANPACPHPDFNLPVVDNRGRKFCSARCRRIMGKQSSDARSLDFSVQFLGHRMRLD